jgi:hypothetical protein
LIGADWDAELSMWNCGRSASRICEPEPGSVNGDSVHPNAARNRRPVASTPIKRRAAAALLDARGDGVCMFGPRKELTKRKPGRPAAPGRAEEPDGSKLDAGKGGVNRKKVAPEAG